MKRLLLVGVASVALAACGGASAVGVGRIGDAERTRSSVAGHDGQSLAPQAFAEADAALKQAKDAHAAGDATGAELHAERAIAAYQRAIALARVARATEEEAAARQALATAGELAARYTTARAAAERETDDLEKQLRIAREARLPAASGAADPERERARLVAAQALATHARLLCSAARLVSPQAPGLGEAEASVTDLEKKLEAAPKPAPIDAASRARAACLGALTKARRASGPVTDGSDTLLGELSRAMSATTPGETKAGAIDLSPARDERGVVVTLRGAFKGEGFADGAEAALKDLGRVGAAHPTYGVQVVVHDAQAPSSTEASANKKRGDAIASALTAGGTAAAKIKVEQAGARAPIVDPTDAKRRGRNARVEIVFVGGS